MNGTIKLILKEMQNKLNKKFKHRTPDPNETEQETESLDREHEFQFYESESFKLGFLLALEIVKE